MDSILTDTSPDAMAGVIQADLRAAWATYAQGPNSRLRDDERMSRVFTSLPVPIYNAITHFRYEANQADEAIAETLAYFRDAGVPCSWWLGPLTMPSDIDVRLRALRPSYTESLPGMAMALETPIPSRALPQGDVIEEINNDDGLLEYLDVDFIAFGFDRAHVPKLADICRAWGYGPDGDWRHFAVRRNGRIVANTSLFTGAGVAGLYGVATHPDARGQGLATSLVLHAMRTAQQRGYRNCTLQASEMGAPVYQKIGFRTYCQIRLYEWRLPYNM